MSHTIKIHLGEKGYDSYVELDGQPLPNVIRIQVEADRRESEVTITFKYVDVEIDGTPKTLTKRLGS